MIKLFGFTKPREVEPSLQYYAFSHDTLARLGTNVQKFNNFEELFKAVLSGKVRKVEAVLSSTCVVSEEELKDLDFIAVAFDLPPSSAWSIFHTRNTGSRTNIVKEAQLAVNSFRSRFSAGVTYFRNDSADDLQTVKELSMLFHIAVDSCELVQGTDNHREILELVVKSQCEKLNSIGVDSQSLVDHLNSGWRLNTSM